MIVYEIRTIEDLNKFSLQNVEVSEDISIDIKLKLIDEDINYPINVKHLLPGLSSKINIRLALFGKSKVKMPAEILVEKDAINTSTDFKAIVLLMSPHSSAAVTPGLLIHEKNILSASHGVVIKNIKDKDLVYLRARGLNKAEAKEMVIGF